MTKSTQFITMILSVLLVLSLISCEQDPSISELMNTIHMYEGNRIPDIQLMYLPSTTFEGNQAYKITMIADDPDGDLLMYGYQAIESYIDIKSNGDRKLEYYYLAEDGTRTKNPTGTLYHTGAILPYYYQEQKSFKVMDLNTDPSNSLFFPRDLTFYRESIAWFKPDNVDSVVHFIVWVLDITGSWTDPVPKTEYPGLPNNDYSSIVALYYWSATINRFAEAITIEPRTFDPIDVTEFTSKISLVRSGGNTLQVNLKDTNDDEVYDGIDATGDGQIDLAFIVQDGIVIGIDHDADGTTDFYPEYDVEGNVLYMYTEEEGGGEHVTLKITSNQDGTLASVDGLDADRNGTLDVTF